MQALPDDHLKHALRPRKQAPRSYKEDSGEESDGDDDYSTTPRLRARSLSADEAKDAEEYIPSSSQESQESDDFQPSQEDKAQLDIFCTDVTPLGETGSAAGDTIVDDDELPSSQDSTYTDTAPAPHERFTVKSAPENVVPGTIFTEKEMQLLAKAVPPVCSPNQFEMLKHGFGVVLGVPETEVEQAYRVLNINFLDCGEALDA